MQASFCSHKGLRDQNEDNHNIILNLTNKNDNINEIDFVAIYDGHGGKHVSKYISNTLPVYFVNKSVKYPLQHSYIIDVFNHLQQKISTIPESQFCGSTSITLSYYIKNNNKYFNITNLGDSKIVMCRNDVAIPLTKDHRPMWPCEKKRIEKLGGKIYFDGDDWRIKDYSVSRAFGDIDSKPFISHIPDLYKYKLDKNDKFFIMACDGLWDYVSEQDSVNFVLATSFIKNKRIKDIKQIADKLAKYAFRKGSTDNVSIIVGFL